MRRADLSKKDALVETNNNESVSTSFNKTITNIVISVLTVVGMFLIVGTSIYSAPYSSGLGDGSANNPYIILNLQDWNDFATDIAGQGNVANGGAGVYFKLTADLGSENPADRVTRPIGDGSYGVFFRGTFDGNNKTVWVDINMSAMSLGLFCRLDGATIKDLTVRGSITNTNQCAGGIAGHLQGTSSILNCSNYAKITANTYAGGIIAATDNGAVVTLTNCHNYNTVTASQPAGGIVGNASSVISIKIDRSENYGSVTSNGYATAGIVGLITGDRPFVNIFSCVNNGVISGDYYVSGIVGYIDATQKAHYLSPFNSYNIVGNYNSGTIKPLNEYVASTCMAGIIGKATDAFKEFVARTTKSKNKIFYLVIS